MLYAPFSGIARRLVSLFRPASPRRRYAAAAIEALESRTLLSATVQVLGNSAIIADNDLTPSQADYTDYGWIGVKFGEVTRTYTIQNIGDQTLGIISTKVSNNSYFITSSPAGAIAANGTSTFTVTFDPRHAGKIGARITIKTSDPDNPTFVFSITGTGLNAKLDKSNGLQVATIQAGTGARTTLNGQELQVNYTGYLVDGTVFDSSLLAGHTPFAFTLGNGAVISGWDKGLTGMKIGESRILIIPAALAYGDAGQGSVPPDATLIFKVDLLAITGPTLTIAGNGQNIVDGATAPSLDDDTDFGTIANGATLIHYFTIDQAGDGVLSARPNVRIVSNDGPGQSQFNLLQPFTDASNNVLFGVRYQPTKLGTATTTITVRTNDPDHPDFTFEIQGTTDTPPAVDFQGSFGSKLKVPPQVGDGDTFLVPVDVANFGWPTAKGRILITVKASSDNVYDDSDVTIGVFTQEVNIVKHGDQVVNVPVTIPDIGTLPAGSYRLVAKIESVDDFGEVKTDDNFVTSSQTGTTAVTVVPAKPDLSVTVSLPKPNRTAYLPGEKIMIPVKVTNGGIRTADASVANPIDVDIRRSTDATFDLTDFEITMLQITKPILAGGSQTFMVPYTIPNDFSDPANTPTAFFAVASVDTGAVTDEINETNNTGASASIPAAIEFGFIGRGGSTSATFYDDDGTKVTASLTRAGVGTITHDNAGFHIFISGTDQKSNVSIIATKTSAVNDDGRFAVNSFSIGNADNTPVKTINAPKMDLTGNFTIAGPADSITIGNFTGDPAADSTFSIGAAAFFSRTPLTLNLVAGDISDMSLTSAIGIRKLSVQRWRDTNLVPDTITAPFITSLAVTGVHGGITGDFAASVTLSAAHGRGNADATLGNANIAGSITGGTWTVATGRIANVIVAGNMTNLTLTAVSAGAIKVTNGMSGSKLTLTLGVGGQQALNSLTVGGTATNSSLYSSGNVGSLRFGAVVDSEFFAGVKNTVLVKPLVISDFVSPVAANLPRIGSVVITGFSTDPTGAVLSNSAFAAGRINVVTMPDRVDAIDGTSATSFFGFATRETNIGNYTGPETAGLFVDGDHSLITT